MNINGKARLYRKDFDGRPSYQTGIANKKQDGSYETLYVSVQLPKDTEVQDRTVIDITNGFISNYKDRNGNLHIKLIVMDFLTEEDGPADDMGYDDSFITIPEDDELPF